MAGEEEKVTSPQPDNTWWEGTCHPHTPLLMFSGACVALLSWADSFLPLSSVMSSAEVLLNR